MFFADFRLPEGNEPSTIEYCQIFRQVWSRFGFKLAIFNEEKFNKVFNPTLLDLVVFV